MRPRLGWTLLALALCSGGGAAGMQGSVETSDALVVFNQVENGLREFYAGPSRVDRVALTEQYRALLLQACGTQTACPKETAYPLLERMLNTLQDGHTRLSVPAPAEQSGQDSTTPTSGWASDWGFRWGREQDLQVVLEVFPATPAYRAGLKPGDVVVAWRTLPDTGADTLTLERRGVRFERTLMPARLEQDSVMPTLQVRQQVGHLRIPTFFENRESHETIGPRVLALLREAQHQKLLRLVIDLRDNSGGNFVNCLLAANAFVDPITLMQRDAVGESLLTYAGGTLTSRRRPRNSSGPYQVYEPLVPEFFTRWTGQVAVLVNRGTASCGELFAYELQKAGRALIVGERTAGITNGATNRQDLFGGGFFFLTTASTFSREGALLPYAITPDLPQALDLTELARSGRDTVFERAAHELKEPASPPRVH